MRKSGNKLLSLLPPHEFELVGDVLETVSLKPRRILHQGRTSMDHVYFVEEGLVSVQADVGDKRYIEVWLIGCEGMVGAPAVTGEVFSTHRRIVQVGGVAQRVTLQDLRRMMLRAPSLSKMLQAYLVDLLYQTSQAGACNATHPLHRRAARWLLLACATPKPEELPLTHEVLARVLGVRRASITECLHDFQHDGLIETARGRIRIADRPRLERVACPCYFMIRAQRDRFQRRFECASSGAEDCASHIVGA